ncbi:hypothetical protein [Nonomuraea sp. MTCD27]|uniref:hypothetical protein n=1 Tax=Nonomuraea sp. MTCD27 TaxID=1676747 RepID=UPI0035C197DA
MFPPGAADAVGVGRASTPVVVTRRIDGRAGQGVSTPTWMALVKAESDGQHRSRVLAVSAPLRRRCIRASLEAPQS